MKPPITKRRCPLALPFWEMYTFPMAHIINDQIMREGTKIGFLKGDQIFNHEGQKVGYFSEHHIYDSTGHTIGYIEGDYLKTENGDVKVRLEDNRTAIHGEGYSDAARCAVRLLLGE